MNIGFDQPHVCLEDGNIYVNIVEADGLLSIYDNDGNVYSSVMELKSDVAFGTFVDYIDFLTVANRLKEA